MLGGREGKRWRTARMSSDAGREGKRWRTARMLGGRGKGGGELRCWEGGENVKDSWNVT